MYRISVYKDGLHPNVWENFKTTHKLDEAEINDKWDIIDSVLLEYKAYNVHKTPFLDFDTEEDALAFILKFN